MKQVVVGVVSILFIFSSELSPVHAAADPVAKCKFAKAKAAGLKASDLLKAYGVYEKKLNTEKLATKISKAESKFAKAFSKAEENGACPGDAVAIEAKVDDFVADMLGEYPLPSCDEMTPSLDELDAAVGESMVGIANPWGNPDDLKLLVARVELRVGCSFAKTETTAPEMRGAQAAASQCPPTPSCPFLGCVFNQCFGSSYCGTPSNYLTEPVGAYLWATPCLNGACFQHDLCSFRDCVLGSRNVCGDRTGNLDCYFTTRSASCDQPFLAKCRDETCVNWKRPTNRLICSIAQYLADNREPPRCQGDACDASVDETCNPNTGMCTCCGNAVLEGDEECDGAEDNECPDQCIPAGETEECTCCADFSGCWAGTSTGTYETVTCHLNLEQSGTDVSGTVTCDGISYNVSGTVTCGGEISWASGSSPSGDFNANGTLSGSCMNGTWSWWGIVCTDGDCVPVYDSGTFTHCRC